MPTDPWSALQNAARTVPIDFATSGDHTVFTATPGRRFCVHLFFLQVENTVDVLLKSGATAITGTIAMATAALATVLFDNSGAAVFTARAAGDNFVLNLGGNVQVNGFAVITEMTA